jgi:Holliday junction DNA helicase RuvB
MARPQESWNGFIGQRHFVRGIDRLINGSRARGELFPNLLLPGNSGLGKTRFSQILADQIGTKLHQLIGRKDVTLLTIGLQARSWVDGDILLIDEGHALSHEVQECLYRIIDERQGPRIENHPATGQPTLNGTIKVAAVTIFLATDQAGALLPAFKKRFSLTFEFQPYKRSELIAIVRQLATEKGILLKPHAARLLAQSSRGIPRTAGHRLECLAKYWGEANPSVFTTGHVRRFLRGIGIDAHGLGTVDRAFMEFLFERGELGASLRMLAAKLSLDPRYLAADVEPILIQNNFINIAPKGRSLTPAGAEYVRTYKESA